MHQAEYIFLFEIILPFPSYIGNETLLLTFFPRCLLLFVGEKPNALAEPRGEEESLTKKGKKKKAVHWAEEEQLKHYFYFDLDETERGEEYQTCPSRMFTIVRHQCVCEKCQLLMLLLIVTHSQRQ